MQVAQLDTASAVVDSEDCKWPAAVAARDIDQDAVVARSALWARLEASAARLAASVLIDPYSH